MKNYIETFFIDEVPRPLLLILPGGGYERTSVREALPVVKEFSDLNYHQAILYYRQELNYYPELMNEVFELISNLKNNELVTNIHILGFSAGGHLAAYLLTRHFDIFSSGVLCYPVIFTESEYIHENSFKNLLKDYPKNINDVNILNSITSNMPPVYLWHTKEDNSVSFYNSVYMYEALQKNNVKSKLTLFDEGPHGLSLVFEKEVGSKYSEVKKWIKEAKEWILTNN